MENKITKPIAIIGYSGHGYLACDILLSQGYKVVAYCEPQEKESNPYGLTYLGNDREPAVRERLKDYHYFVAVGDNMLRRKVTDALLPILGDPICMSHRSSVISPSIRYGHGVMIAASATVQPLVVLGNGSICSTSSNVDHECIIGDYSHVGPGALLSGSITVGENTFIGANATVVQGIKIGNNVIIGAGAVVLRDVADNKVIIGNPGRELIKTKTNL